MSGCLRDLCIMVQVGDRNFALGRNGRQPRRPILPNLTTVTPQELPSMSFSRDDIFLVTGGTGFVGSAVARALRKQGARVRLLVRKGADRRNLHPDDEIALGDLRDERCLPSAVAGARFLIHCAADYRLWAPTPSELMESNVEGTRNLMRAALAAGIERIVYTSSVATLSLNGAGLADESRPMEPGEAIGTYKRSKVIAERLVEDLVEREKLPAVIVNPSTPIGPGDVKPTPTGRIIVEAASGRMPAFVDTGLNIAHVDDVAEGHLLALAHGRVGERYILGGENVALSRILAEIARMVGRKAPTTRIPLAAVYPLAYICEAFALVTKRPPFVTRDALHMAAKHMFFTDAKARRELGYRSRPYQDALQDAIDWFRGAGLIR